jgi:hypothetical protein
LLREQVLAEFIALLAGQFSLDGGAPQGGTGRGLLHRVRRPFDEHVRRLLRKLTRTNRDDHGEREKRNAICAVDLPELLGREVAWTLLRSRRGHRGHTVISSARTRPRGARCGTVRPSDQSGWPEYETPAPNVLAGVISRRSRRFQANSIAWEEA